MGQRSNYAAVKDVKLKLTKEEFALSMGQRKSVSTRDAQIMLRREEYVGGMEQHGQRNDVAVKDAPNKLRKEEYAGSMEQSCNCSRRFKTISKHFV